MEKDGPEIQEIRQLKQDLAIQISKLRSGSQSLPLLLAMMSDAFKKEKPSLTL